MTDRVAPSILLETKSEVEGGSIFVCSREVTVNGIIDASGVVRVLYGPYVQGCPSGRGISPGHASKKPFGCAGDGGKGGKGGDPEGGNGGDVYDEQNYPLIMGSGGGSVSQSGGPGGGVIVIISNVTHILGRASCLSVPS